MGRGQAKENGEPLMHTKDIIGMYSDPDGRVFGADAPHILSLRKEWVIPLPAQLPAP